MNSPRFGFFASVGALAVAAGLAMPAHATFQDRFLSYAASGVCDVNTPIFDSSVRRKALEFRNISAETVVITCGLVTDDNLLLGGMGQLSVHVTNHRTVSATMSCTMTAGTSQENQVTSKRSVTLPAGGSGMIYWNATHYGSSRQHASFSCALPATWSVNQVNVNYIEDVGL